MSAWTKACMEFSNSLKGLRLGRSGGDDVSKKAPSKSAPTSPEEGAPKDTLNSNVKPATSDLTSSLQRVFKLATHRVRAATADARNGNKPVTLVDHALLHREQVDVWTDDDFLSRFFWLCAPTERGVLAQVCKQWHRIVYQSQYWSRVIPAYDCKTWSNDEIGTSLFYKSLQDRRFDSIILTGAVDSDVSNFVNNFPNCHQFIKTLHVRHSNITDTGLAHLLNKMEGVVRFSISGCNEITEAAMYISLNERITTLSISDCINVGDDSVGAVAQLLPALVELNLQAYHVTDAALTFFSAKQATSVTTLRLWSCWEVTNQGIVNLVHSLPHLTTLSLSGCSKITDDAIEIVAENLRKLTSLDLSWCTRVSDTALEFIACDLSELQELTLDRCSQVTDLGLGFLSTMTSLQRLYLRWCSQLRDFGLQHIYIMKSLQVLSLAGCSLITPTGLSGLQKLKSLRELELTNCPGADGETLEFLHESMPHCAIIE